MSKQSVALSLLIDGDFRGMRRLWPDLFPQYAAQAPMTDKQAEEVMHLARTQNDFVPTKLRRYSHEWLLERGLSSDLPDQLRPKADQVHPVIAAAVGIAVQGRDGSSLIIRDAMVDAVREAEADGKLEDSAHVKARILEAREQQHRLLFGRPAPRRGLLSRIFNLGGKL